MEVPVIAEEIMRVFNRNGPLFLGAVVYYLEEVGAVKPDFEPFSKAEIETYRVIDAAVEHLIESGKIGLALVKDQEYLFPTVRTKLPNGGKK